MSYLDLIGISSSSSTLISSDEKFEYWNFVDAHQDYVYNDKTNHTSVSLTGINHILYKYSKKDNTIESMFPGKNIVYEFSASSDLYPGGVLVFRKWPSSMLYQTTDGSYEHSVSKFYEAEATGWFVINAATFDVLFESDSGAATTYPNGSTDWIHFEQGADGKPHLMLPVDSDPNPETFVQIKGKDVSHSGTDTVFIDVPIEPIKLFSDADDTVDFNNLTDEQKKGISNRIYPYTTLGGNDTIILPDQLHLQLTDNVEWNPHQFFDAGNGDDTLDFRTYDFAHPELEYIQIYGGAEGERGDLIKLPGNASDYDFSVDFGSNALDVMSTYHFISKVGLPFPMIVAIDFEQVVFEKPVSNRIQLTEDSLTLEMLRLANESYGHTGEGGFHTADPLAYEAGDKAYGLTEVAQKRAWHAVSALELGIKPADFGTRVKYSFVNGLYQANGLDLKLDKVQADALVLSGVVNGKTTLEISIRGTDQYLDFTHYDNFAKHYALFQPLVSGILDFLKEQPGQYQQVLLSGHSLGGGVLQYMAKAIEASGTIVKGYTVGSPGSEVASDAPVLNFIHTQDVVPLLGYASQHRALAAVAVLATMPLMFGVPVAAALAKIQEKTLSGSTVWIDSDVAGSYSRTEHDAGLYAQDVAKLLAFAGNGSPFAATDLAKALVAGRAYTSDKLTIAVGRPATDGYKQWSDSLPYASTMSGYAADDFVLGNSDQSDRILLDSLDLFADKASRKIDGGGGINAGDGDLLVLTTSQRNCKLVRSAGDTKVFAKALNSATWSYVATLYRMQGLQFSDGLVYLDGRTVTVQHGPGSGAASLARAAAIPVLKVDTAFDYTDAGDGRMTVLGSTSGDFIVLGNGSKTVKAGAGDDTISVRADDRTDRLVINGGTGADLMMGGRGIESFYVDNVGDHVTVASPGGRHTVYASVDFALGDNIENLVLQARATTGTGNSLANAIGGTTGANTLAGGGGNDALNGYAGDDALFGGLGADILTGGAGADCFIYTGTAESRASTGYDTIRDFSAAAGDKFDLRLVDASTRTAGQQSFIFIGTDDFSNVAGQLDFKVVGGDGFLYGDTNGDAKADLTIKLAGVTSLASSDFLA